MANPVLKINTDIEENTHVLKINTDIGENTGLMGDHQEIIREYNLIEQLQGPIYKDIKLLNDLSSINFFRTCNKKELVYFIDYFNYIMLNYIDKYFLTIKNCLYLILSEVVIRPNIIGVNYKMIINRGCEIINYKNEILYGDAVINDFVYELAFFKDELVKILDFQSKHINPIINHYYSIDKQYTIFEKCMAYWKSEKISSIMIYKIEDIHGDLECIDRIKLFFNKNYYRRIETNIKSIL